MGGGRLRAWTLMTFSPSSMPFPNWDNFLELIKESQKNFPHVIVWYNRNTLSIKSVKSNLPPELVTPLTMTIIEHHWRVCIIFADIPTDLLSLLRSHVLHRISNQRLMNILIPFSKLEQIFALHSTPVSLLSISQDQFFRLHLWTLSRHTGCCQQRIGFLHWRNPPAQRAGNALVSQRQLLAWTIWTAYTAVSHEVLFGQICLQDRGP